MQMHMLYEIISIGQKLKIEVGKTVLFFGELEASINIKLNYLVLCLWKIK
jgi:hypothetical protein